MADVFVPIPDLSVTLVGGGALRIDLPSIVDAAWRGASVAAAEVDSAGFVGATNDGALVYRPAEGFSGVERIELTLRAADGASRALQVAVDVRTGPLHGGWGDGEHYVLARDAAGWSVTEPGERHRVVYVSPDGNAAADGLTAETAVNLAGLDRLMKTLLIDPKQPKLGSIDASWHVLFERGHDYGAFAPSVINGEDPLHPFVVGAYGEGARPLFGNAARLWDAQSNVVIRDVEFARSPLAEASRGDTYRQYGVDMLDGGHGNVMFENVVVRPHNASARIQGDSDGVTFYRSLLADASYDAPTNGAADWTRAADYKAQGLFGKALSGLLIEETFFHHNGWREGYDPEGGAGPQPPSKFSHNLYLATDVSDVTIRGSAFGEASSAGAQLRGGAFVADTLFFANNVGLFVGPGNPVIGGWSGERSVVLDTVITAPSNKDAFNIGARGWGMQLDGAGAVVDSIVAQDGDGLTGYPDGVVGALQLSGKQNGYVLQDATVFNWGKALISLPSAIGGAAQFLAVTLDAFARSELGGSADSDDLSAAWRGRDRADWGLTSDAADVVAYFREGFQYPDAVAAQNRTVRFEADPIAEGFRWDNRLNWSDDRAPISGDVVSVNGHAVSYGGQTLQLAGLDLGQGGLLRIAQGALKIAGATTAGSLGGAVIVDNSGQFTFSGYRDSDRLALTVAEGRAVNSGVVDGALSVEARGGQLVLAQAGGTFRLGAAAELTVRGGDVAVGFDAPSGRAALVLDGGALNFVADAAGLAVIGEFTSGRYGTAAPGVYSEVALRAGAIKVDLAAMGAVGPGDVTLIDADAISGVASQLSLTLTGAPQGLYGALVVDAARGDLLLRLSEQSTPPSGGGAGGGDMGGATDPADLAVLAAGQDVRFVGGGATVDQLVFAGGATLTVTGGTLGVVGADGIRSDAEGASALVDGGVFRFAGYGRTAERLALTVADGEVVNTARVTGVVDLVARGGETTLVEAGGLFRLNSGSRVTVEGEALQIGFGGEGGSAILNIAGGELSFIFDADGVAAIAELPGGAATAALGSTVRLNGGRLTVDLSAADPIKALGRHVLVDADYLTGSLDGFTMSVVGAPDGVRTEFGVEASQGLVYVDVLA